MRMNQHASNTPIFSRDGSREALVSRCWRSLTLFFLLALGLASVSEVGFAEVTDFAVPAENEFVKKGFLPVTLFGAVPDDELDDTAAIQETVDAALQAHGGSGFTEDTGLYEMYPLVRLLRTAPVNRELCLSFIGEKVMGLPRSY